MSLISFIADAGEKVLGTATVTSSPPAGGAAPCSPGQCNSRGGDSEIRGISKLKRAELKHYLRRCVEDGDSHGCRS